LNAYVILKILNYGSLPHISRFENYFCIKKMVDYGARGVHPKIVGYKNLDELKARLERVSIRRTKDEMRGFPDRSFIIRDVELSGKQLALYRTICGEIVKELSSKSITNIFQYLTESTKVLRLRQIMNSPELLNEEGDSAKYEE